MTRQFRALVVMGVDSGCIVSKEAEKSSDWESELGDGSNHRGDQRKEQILCHKLRAVK